VNETPSLELAVIGNCQIAALIDGRGCIVWCCLPRPDGDPVFSALLRRDGGAAEQGVFAIELTDLVRSEQHYVHNTAIVETLLYDAHGNAVRITDFCPRFRGHGRVFRPMMLVRIVEPLHGKPVISTRLQPSAGYGSQQPRGQAGSHHLRFEHGELKFRVTTDASITVLTEQRPRPLEGAQVYLLGPDDTIAESVPVLARSFLEQTRDYWQDWVRTLAIPFEWQQAVIRAAITLKLCTFEDTGAVLAALTTSIPESPGSTRTWDYRYCWLRDSYFVIQALNRLGATRTMEAYLHFIDHTAAHSSVGALQPLYGISGESQLDEKLLDSLDGFRGNGPVRVGNLAAIQTQHDVYGSVILASTQLFFDQRLVSGGDLALFQRLEKFGEMARRVYDQVDAGPWELRNSQHVHTFSSAVSWAGCDRLARIARRLGLGERATYWQSSADAMRQVILKRAWNEQRQAFSATLDGDELDASMLLLHELGLVSADDPRFAATVTAIGRDLADGDLLYRYRYADDFGRPEVAFVVCAFWYVNALAAIGRRAQAREVFERLLARRTALGLLSEDIDPRSGELWGNFPQTYSMVGIITSALRLSQSWEDAL